MNSVDGSEEIKTITNVLDDIKENYYIILKLLDSLEEDEMDNILNDDYKRIIDAIKGVKKYS